MIHLVRRQIGLPWLAAILAALTGCGGERADTAAVTVYVSIDRKDAEPILAEFTQRTRIEVRAVYDAEIAKTTLLVGRLMAEAERPQCDVFWNNENVQTLMLAERGLLEPYQSPQAKALAPKWRDHEGRWTAVATRARVIVYNTRLVPEGEAPRTLRELTESKWRGKLAIANPQFGTTRTHVAALHAALGAEQAQAFLGDLLANEARIVDGNAMVKNLVARAGPGASPILVGLTDTDDVASGQADDEPVALVYPDQDGQGTLVIPSTVCMLRGAPHPAEARQLVDFLISGAAGRLLAELNAGYQPLLAEDEQDSAPSEIKTLDVSGDDILKQLPHSTEWTARHFRP